MNNLGLIPLPSKIEIASGKTLVDNQWSIKHNNNHTDLDYLKDLLTQSLNNHKITLNKYSNKTISLVIRTDDGLNDEDYILNIHKDKILIINLMTTHKRKYIFDTNEKTINRQK